MTRVIAAPPPEVITQLSELITLVLNAKEVAKTIDSLKSASNEYQAARLDYEVSISKSVIAQKAAQDKLDEAQPLIEQSIAEKAEAQRYLQELAEFRAELSGAESEFERMMAEKNSAVAAAQSAIDAQKAELEKLLADARVAAEEAANIRQTLSRKLAVLQEA